MFKESQYILYLRRCKNKKQKKKATKYSGKISGVTQT